ncbi:MAG: 30S ribosomal protein S20 [Chlamydiae bacterium]|nr:30S ribosomal protein S20 [Chlamydiota bacterium]
MADKQQAKKKEKVPTAKKRILQSKRRQLANKILKTKVKNTCKDLISAPAEEKSTLLNDVYQWVDKAVKKGVFKLNKGSRIKARFARLSTKA